MNWLATFANSLWFGSSLLAWRRYRRALAQPGATQRELLSQVVRTNADTAFGRAHGFGSIHNYEDFVARVPLMDYVAHAPWIERIQRGEARVLTHDPVTHLVPTSGTSGGRKLIPFTASLKSAFNAALGPWLVDLARQRPGVLGGPAYWSVTPKCGTGLQPAYPSSSHSSHLHSQEALSNHARQNEMDQQAASLPRGVPVGFEDDTAYLGPVARRLANAVMAVPSSVQHAASLEEFRYRTLLHLVRERDLRLISVWHPSFLTLLLEALPGFWDELLKDVAQGRSAGGGSCRTDTGGGACATGFVGAKPSRARELLRADPLWPGTIWPELRMISCWADGHAALGAEDLRRRFSGVLVQTKGLLATEAFVTLPFAGLHPLAITSHFFEFIDDTGAVRLADELRDGAEYDVVVTNGGGLWRYRLGDRVRVDGRLASTPSLRFLGRSGGGSDRRGEKLTEEFVAACLRELFTDPTAVRFSLLAPEDEAEGCRYVLFVEGDAHPHWPEQLDALLRRNPHYAVCRDLGQLLPPELCVIPRDGFTAYATRLAANGARLGDIKPAALSALTGWSRVFAEV